MDSTRRFRGLGFEVIEFVVSSGKWKKIEPTRYLGFMVWGGYPGSPIPLN